MKSKENCGIEIDGSEIDGIDISGNLSHSGHEGNENSGHLMKSREIFGIVTDGNAIFGKDILGREISGKEMFCGGSR